MSAHALSARAGATPFSTRFVASHEAPALLADPRVLALVEFGEGEDDAPRDPRRIRVGLRQLGAPPIAEIWESESPVEAGTRGRVAYAMNEQVLFGHVVVDDRRHPSLEAATRAAYESFLPVAAELGFRHFLRMWNYIPDINAEQHGVERYKAFCVGRHAAFAAFGLPERSLPAASGVGSRSGGLLVYFLAAREPGAQVENPRQVSAFRYPSRYGPKSPAFSRAVAKDWGAARHVYVSGTASIVGHASCHGERVVAQLEESLRNVRALMHRADSEHGVGARSLHDLTQIKVYVRDTSDVDAVRGCIEHRLSDARRVLYLAGDLCRADLPVELEGLYTG